MARPLVIILCVILTNIIPVNAAYLHGGDICFDCHRRLNTTFEINPGVQVMGLQANCDKCHGFFRTDDPERRAKGQEMHMDICKGCHEEVHTLHKERKIGCRVCHQSPRGWNSSIVELPAPKKEDMMVFEGVEIAIPKSGDCGYCHINARRAERVHDVHETELGKICKDCHPTIEESRQARSGHELVKRYLWQPKGEEKAPPFLVLEFSRYFTEISKNIEALFLSRG
jgi:hypothetical protein